MRKLFKKKIYLYIIRKKKMPKLQSKVETAEKTQFINDLKSKDKKASTITEYTRKYDAIYNSIKRPQKELDYDDIVEYLDTVTNVNTRASQLNIFLLLNEDNTVLKEKLKKKRESISGDILAYTQSSNNDIKPVALDILNNYMEHLFATGKWDKYIINYLLLKFYVRNEDVNVNLYDSDVKPIGNENFLQKINKNTILYQRNKYKTYDIHGRKEHYITDKQFMHAFTELSETQDKLITKKAIGTEVKNATYEELGEAKYLKYAIEDIRATGDIDKLVEISRSRGTDIKLLLSSYNLKMKIV